LRDFLGKGQVAVGISGLDGSFDADLAVAKRLGDFCDDLGDSQPTGWIGRIDGLNLRCTLKGAIS
jgi:hypothetical protein